MKVNLVSTAALVASVIILERETRTSPWDGLRMAGAIVGLIGAAIIVIARLQLRRPFGESARPAKLITTGLYAKVRNPIYVGGMILIAGLAMYVHKPWMMLGVIVLLPVQIHWTRAEERELREAFGEEYERYRAQTWF